MASDDQISEPDRLEGAPHPRFTTALLGQKNAEQDLLEAWVNGRLNHGWLITGPRGTGKATLAWKCARFLLGRDDISQSDTPQTLEVSADLPTSHRLAALSEPRLFLCRRPWDAKRERCKKDITVDEVRRLKEFFNLSATDGGNRVVIIDSADEMNPSAANALLKILEEPPEKTTIFLISHRPMRLLPTIRSRCREVKCTPLGATDIARALASAGFDAGADAAAITLLANGSVGEAIAMLAQNGVGLYASLVALLSRAPGMERPALIALAQSCVGKGTEARYDLVLRLAQVLLHRLALKGTGVLAPAEAAPQETQIFQRLSPDAAAARRWSTLAQTLAGRTQHARAVNLDPASVILDMFLKIDAMAGIQLTA